MLCFPLSLMNPLTLLELQLQSCLFLYTVDYHLAEYTSAKCNTHLSSSIIQTELYNVSMPLCLCVLLACKVYIHILGTFCVEELCRRTQNSEIKHGLIQKREDTVWKHSVFKGKNYQSDFTFLEASTTRICLTAEKFRTLTNSLLCWSEVLKIFRICFVYKH
jgi:hypothetical protein